MPGTAGQQTAAPRGPAQLVERRASSPTAWAACSWVLRDRGSQSGTFVTQVSEFTKTSHTNAYLVKGTVTSKPTAAHVAHRSAKSMHRDAMLLPGCDAPDGFVRSTDLLPSN